MSVARHEDGCLAFTHNRFWQVHRNTLLLSASTIAGKCTNMDLYAFSIIYYRPSCIGRWKSLPLPSDHIPTESPSSSPSGFLPPQHKILQQPKSNVLCFTDSTA